MNDLLKTMRALRAPDGCPWDIKQTHLSLRPYLLEEAAEAVDAISSGDSSAMTEELGDVLLQIAFHSVIAEQENTFAYEDVERNIVEKLVRRHPHVFGTTEVADADEVVTNWQAIKTQEKKGKAVEPAAPHSLSALMRASELSKKLDWEIATKDEIKSKAEKLESSEASVAELLLAVVSFAKSQGINSELALRDLLLEREGE